MYLKVQKMRLDGPDLPWITEGVEFYEGERIYANRATKSGSSEPTTQFWVITIEGAQGAVSIESNSNWRYYILNNDGKTIDSL
jgi:hypothetical protein